MCSIQWHLSLRQRVCYVFGKIEIEQKGAKTLAKELALLAHQKVSVGARHMQSRHVYWVLKVLTFLTPFCETFLLTNTVFVIPESVCYHQYSCVTIQNNINEVYYIENKDSAIAAGYRVCPQCIK